MSAWTKRSKRRGVKSQYTARKPSSRILVVAFVWVVLTALVIGRLIQIQVLDHAKFKEVRQRYFKNRKTILAKRGAILDRNGKVLAEDLIYYSLAVRPKKLKPFNTSIKRISNIIDVPVRKIKSRLAGKHRFTYLAHRLSPEKAGRLQKLNLPGVVLEKKISRYYPYHRLAAQAIGYSSYDNVPSAGLELRYDRFLGGTPGWMIFSRDAFGKRLPNLDFPVVNPIDGMNLVTTIDIVYQGVVEEELVRAIKKHEALSGSAILLNASTGEVLALANYPGFDPNQYNQYPVQNYRNSAISDLYEPGSTFKIVALALTIEQLKMNLDRDIIYCENGSYNLFRNVIRDHRPFGYLTVRKVFEESSNIGVIKIAQKFSAPVFYRYARDFGFGTTLGIDLPAESAGILHRPAEYSRTSLSYMSIGYEVAVTPLQLAAAYGAVANNGKLMRPYVVQKVTDKNGKTVLKMKPENIRQVVSPLTSSYMRATLAGVVKEGTGRSAFIKGLGIGGKTGTSQKIDKVTNRYSSQQHVASFVGFFPLEAPRFILLVVVNNPKNGYYGSQVAAPAFKNIAQRIVGLPNFEFAALPAVKLDTEAKGRGDISRPENRNSASGKAGFKLVKTGLSGAGKNRGFMKSVRSKLFGVQQTVRKKRNSNVTVRERRKIMPKLRGLTLKEALKILDDLKMAADIDGYGVVVRQVPLAGKKIDEKIKVKIVCRPT